LLPSCGPFAHGPWLQEGYYDAAGNYLEFDRPDERDAWLESIEVGL
jgi:hypothetical protein